MLYAKRGENSSKIVKQIGGINSSKQLSEQDVLSKKKQGETTQKAWFQ